MELANEGEGKSLGQCRAWVARTGGKMGMAHGKALELPGERWCGAVGVLLRGGRRPGGGCCGQEEQGGLWWPAKGCSR